jgi:hypothetical protein
MLGRRSRDPDSSGYPPDDDSSERADIPGYPSVSEGDSDADSARYPSSKPGVVGMPKGAPLFQDSGFESIEDYLDHLDHLWRRQNGLPPVTPPGLKPVHLRDGHGSRQVGLRLPETDYRRLLELGDEYGVAPATMARMIVVGVLRARCRNARDDD